MPTSRRLYVHIGLPKTGTSFLQANLLHNRQVLAEQGLDLVPPTKREAFELMLLVRNRYEPALDSASVQSSLDRFPTLLENAPGSRALISQESLAAATPRQIRRFLDACGDREVHVIATVRDLARQLPSAWQQRLKSGASMTYDEFLRRAQALEQRGVERWPWRHLNVTEMLALWSQAVGPSRMHVVTLPPPDSASSTLLERFCSVLDLDPDRMVPEEKRVNTSLGRVQAELLRRVNGELPEEVLPRQIYGGVGKRFFAAQVLAAQEARPIRVPAQFRGWCDEVAERQIKALEAAGYLVTGQPADLRCPDQAFGDDDQPSHRDVEETAVKALAQILELRAEAVRRRQEQTRRSTAGRDTRSLRARARRLLGRFRNATRG